MPLACSITIRDSSAASSCDVTTQRVVQAPAPAGCRSWRCRRAPARPAGRRRERFGAGREDVERADHLAAESHRQRRHRREADFLRVGREVRPACATASAVKRAVHRDAVAVRVEARTLVVLQLEQLDEAHALARRRDVVERAVAVGEHDAGFRRVDELDATRREPVQELDDVVFVDDRVGELDERGEQILFSGHEVPPSGVRYSERRRGQLQSTFNQNEASAVRRPRRLR